MVSRSVAPVGSESICAQRGPRGEICADQRHLGIRLTRSRSRCYDRLTDLRGMIEDGIEQSTPSHHPRIGLVSIYSSRVEIENLLRKERESYRDP